MLLVKWKDYEDPADRTYEPEENLLVLKFPGIELH